MAWAHNIFEISFDYFSVRWSLTDDFVMTKDRKEWFSGTYSFLCVAELSISLTVHLTICLSICTDVLWVKWNYYQRMDIWAACVSRLHACLYEFAVWEPAVKSKSISTAEARMFWGNKVMMTSSNGNIFRVTGHLCGEFTGPRWIPLTKASDAELWYFLWSAPE